MFGSQTCLQYFYYKIYVLEIDEILSESEKFQILTAHDTEVLSLPTKFLTFWTCIDLIWSY